MVKCHALFKCVRSREKRTPPYFVQKNSRFPFIFYMKKFFQNFDCTIPPIDGFNATKTYFACAATNCMGPVASAAEAAGYVTSTNLTRSTSTKRAADGERKSIKFRTRRFQHWYVALVRAQLHVQWHSISMSSRPSVVAELYLDEFFSALMFSFMAKTVGLAEI